MASDAEVCKMRLCEVKMSPESLDKWLIGSGPAGKIVGGFEAEVYLPGVQPARQYTNIRQLHSIDDARTALALSDADVEKLLDSLAEWNDVDARVRSQRGHPPKKNTLLDMFLGKSYKTIPEMVHREGLASADTNLVDPNYDVVLATAFGKLLKRYVGMPVEVSKTYHAGEKKPGTWYIEPDESLADRPAEDLPIEVVSPPLPLRDLMVYLDRFFDLADDTGLKTNKRTGFHFGVSMDGGTVDPLKFLIFLGDEYIIDQFGRRLNPYAKSAVGRVKSHVQSELLSDPGYTRRTISGLRNSLDLTEVLTAFIEREDRMFSVNFSHGHYLEIRSMGSNYLSDYRRLYFTILRICRAFAIACDPTAARQEYLTKAYKLLDQTYNPERNEMTKTIGHRPRLPR